MRKSRQLACLIAALLFAASATLSAQHVLSTSLDYDNNQDGVMFDVDASSDLRITGISVIPTNGTMTTWEIWRVTDGSSFVGVETDLTAWTLLGTNTIAGAPLTLLPLGIALDIEMKASDPALGIYVTTTGGIGSNVRYTNGTNSGGLRAQTPHLQVFEGIGKVYPFAGNLGSTTPGSISRMFNGQIHYELGSAGTSATLVTPAANVAGAGLTFDIRAQENVTVEGFSIALNAGTFDLEVWTPVTGGSSLPILTNASAWMLAGSVANFTAPVQGVYNVGFDLDIPIAANTSRGFYVTRPSPSPAVRVDTLSVTAVGDTVAFDESIVVEAGNARGYAFAGVGTVAGFAGEVHYRRNIIGSTANMSTSVLTTPNGSNQGQGLFFDLAAAGDFVQVDDLDALMLAGTHTVELWTVNDRTTHIGKETNSALWTLQGSATVNVAADDTMTDLFSNLRIVLEPGQAQGCYIVTNPPTVAFSYSFASQGVTYASDSRIEVRGGSRSSATPWMISVVNRGPDLRVRARYNVSTASSVAEDFSGAIGITPPSGWLSHVGDIDDVNVDGWNFSNPQPISPAALPPIDANFAVVDSDASGPGSSIDASLYSPRFDASQGNSSLSFDHVHNPLSSTISVDIWDGTVWNNLLNTTMGTANPEHAYYDITAAAGGATNARVRFRYVGTWDYHWALDNVRINTVGDGQEPRPGLGLMDINYAVERNGRPVASNLPGPYFADGYTSTPVVFEFEGEPNQPVLLMQGLLNVNGWDFLAPGKLDIGIFNPGSMTFSFLEQLAYGADPGLINNLFVTSPVGNLQLAFPLPPFTAGNTYNFQGLVLNSRINAALTNMVRLSVIN